MTRYKDQLEKHLNTKYGEDTWIQNFDDEQLYLNRDAILEKGVQLKNIQQDAVDFLVNIEGINSALTAYHANQSI